MSYCSFLLFFSIKLFLLSIKMITYNQNPVNKVQFITQEALLIQLSAQLTAIKASNTIIHTDPNMYVTVILPSQSNFSICTTTNICYM